MFDVLFDGAEYRVVPIGSDCPGWMTLDPANTIQQAYSIAKKDWDHFWRHCGIVPFRKLIVTVA
jgi:hypothetical protein